MYVPQFPRNNFFRTYVNVAVCHFSVHSVRSCHNKKTHVIVANFQRHQRTSSIVDILDCLEAEKPVALYRACMEPGETFGFMVAAPLALLASYATFYVPLRLYSYGVFSTPFSLLVRHSFYRYVRYAVCPCSCHYSRLDVYSSCSPC